MDVVRKPLEIIQRVRKERKKMNLLFFEWKRGTISVINYQPWWHHGGNRCWICWRLPHLGGGESVFVLCTLAAAEWHHGTAVREITFRG